MFSVGVVMYVRTLFLDVVEQMFPSLGEGFLWPMLVVGVLLFVGVSALNVWIVRRKVESIWMSKH